MSQGLDTLACERRNHRWVSLVRLSSDGMRDVVLYVAFGVCTTVVNIVVYWLAAHVLGTGVMAGTVVAWVAAVLFAYLTNRRWVFHSEARGAAALARERGGHRAELRGKQAGGVPEGERGVGPSLVSSVLRPFATAHALRGKAIDDHANGRPGMRPADKACVVFETDANTQGD